MVWLTGMIISGLLFWLMWTYETHIVVGILTIPGSFYHLYKNFHDHGRAYLYMRNTDDDFPDNLLVVGIIIVFLALMIACSWNFFRDYHHSVMVLAGVWYLILIASQTLFLDITARI